MQLYAVVLVVTSIRQFWFCLTKSRPEKHCEVLDLNKIKLPPGNARVRVCECVFVWSTKGCQLRTTIPVNDYSQLALHPRRPTAIANEQLHTYMKLAFIVCVCVFILPMHSYTLIQLPFTHFGLRLWKFSQPTSHVKLVQMNDETVLSHFFLFLICFFVFSKRRAREVV